MFTLKIYAWPRVRIVEAQSFTIYWYDALRTSCQLTVHQKNLVDEAFYIGDPLVTDPSAQPVAGMWFDRAIIENSSGKTTENIQPVKADDLPSLR